MKNRQEKLAYIKQNYLAASGLGLEISPSINPMFTADDDYTVEYLDACSTEKLLQRAAHHGVDAARVPRVSYRHDFAQSIATCVAHKTFDFAVSSHVIEHVPDLVGHFQEVREVLNEGGIYAFLAPDRDLCFDAQKPLSSLGQIVEAHVEKHRAAPLNALIDEYFYAVKREEQGAWSRAESAPFASKYNDSETQIRELLENPASVKRWHGHIWRFTPNSFQHIFDALGNFGLVDFHLVDLVPTPHTEFIVVLRTGAATAESNETLSSIAR